MLTTSLHVASEKPSIGLKTDGVELLRTSRPSGLRPWDQILGDWKTASRMDLFPGGTPLKGMKGGFFWALMLVLQTGETGDCCASSLGARVTLLKTNNSFCQEI